MPKEKSRSERYSREKSKDRERRKRSRSRDKDREKDRRRTERKRSRSRGRDERPRRRSRSSRDPERHRRSSRDRDRRREKSKSRESDTAAQQAQINQFLSASLSGLTGPSTVHSIAGHAFAQQQLLHQEGYRTDFSNLFHNSANASSAFAIAAAKAAQITSSKNLTDYMHNHNNGGMSDSSRDGVEFHGGSAENSASGAGDGKRKKKSRWATGNDNDKTFIPGMPTILPSTMTPDQQEAYLDLHLLSRSTVLMASA